MTARASGRDLKTRVAAGKGRTHSSQLWLRRQLNDPYVARAKREGLRSRAAFKLSEIDDKARILKSGGKVIDLGAAPGGWSQVAARRVGAAEGRGRVVAIDILDMAPISSTSRTRRPRSGSRRCLPVKPMWCSPTWPPTPPGTAGLIT
jgi:23S rRNA (uridine2552-2'-O)-methyltransferase